MSSAAAEPSRDAPSPAWLSRAVGLAALAVAVLLCCEVFWFRPGYAVGDEADQVGRLLSLGHTPDPVWAWARGSLQRVGLWLWLACVGDGPRRLHLPALAVLALECALLRRLARRWFSAEAADWALLFNLLCAATWLRGRSILSYEWLPLELLALALWSGRVNGWGGAVLWGLAAALLLLDYEGAEAALPGLFVACLWKEEGFRRRFWAWAPAFFLGAALLAESQAPVLRQYVGLRRAVNWGAAGAVLTAWRVNLGQLVTGGSPMPYLGVWHWPAVAAWSLPPLAWGLWECRGRGGWGVALWAATAVAVTQAATAPWGVPCHRLAAAWPALCLLAGLGGAGLRARLGRRVSPGFWLALLALGFLAEANAYYRHMAFHGREVYGRSEDLAAAARDARAARAQGAAVCTALLELRAPDAGFFVRPAPPARPDAPAWVFLPPEFHALCARSAGARVYRASPRDVPTLVLVADGAQALRFEAVDRSLRPLLGRDSAGDEIAWLARPGGDPWACDAVLDRLLRRLWTGLDFEPGLARLCALRPAVTPGPPDLLGRYFTGRSPALALSLLTHALVLDPDWAPALEDRAAALEALGKADAARAERALLARRLAGTAWRTYD